MGGTWYVPSFCVMVGKAFVVAAVAIPAVVVASSLPSKKCVVKVSLFVELDELSLRRNPLFRTPLD